MMAAGKFEFDSIVLSLSIGGMFSKETKYKNPFDRPKLRQRTPEEIAEEEAAAKRVAEVKEKVFRRIQERENGARRKQ